MAASDEEPPTRAELARRLAREQKVRLEAEAIAETVTGELYDASQDLRRANQELHAFLAMTAHDLRGPLTSILGSTELLDRFDELDPAARELAVGVIRRSGHRLERLVEDLLMIATIRTGSVAPRREPVVLHAAVRESLEELGEEELAPLEVDLPPDLAVAVDRDHLHRIVMNTVGNAMKYGSPPIAISGRATNGMAELVVTDHGPGVAPTFVEHLFDDFTRSSEVDAHVPGTGLGLAIVRELVAANGGHVTYEPVDPHGARFTVRLPLDGDATPQPSPTADH